ncbi:hypothetical protein A3D03_03840 [Candidatus Gottesmanbacteria bacterium RIFCSPHIGHO2_02_FULL_40_13]|uniref:Uncharacterized protein n=1 Tax=Candidatus Gottesmanbacteria bacterium RIFCSPHIGHO2_02_FULL_40_13 TaxID=1798384 RepID=A0A1F6A6F4_9BACT|nr:MAG: hypothetical protein A3D03_03840 [Candidatus Gottesmanbacteria bacterium RIFCSPHIGHO2_02_FULL_40_13]
MDTSPPSNTGVFFEQNMQSAEASFGLQQRLFKAVVDFAISEAPVQSSAYTDSTDDLPRRTNSPPTEDGRAKFHLTDNTGMIIFDDLHLAHSLVQKLSDDPRIVHKGYLPEPDQPQDLSKRKIYTSWAHELDHLNRAREYGIEGKVAIRFVQVPELNKVSLEYYFMYSNLDEVLQDWVDKFPTLKQGNLERTMESKLALADIITAPKPPAGSDRAALKKLLHIFTPDTMKNLSIVENSTSNYYLFLELQSRAALLYRALEIMTLEKPSTKDLAIAKAAINLYENTKRTQYLPASGVFTDPEKAFDMIESLPQDNKLLEVAYKIAALTTIDLENTIELQSLPDDISKPLAYRLEHFRSIFFAMSMSHAENRLGINNKLSSYIPNMIAEGLDVTQLLGPLTPEEFPQFTERSPRDDFMDRHNLLILLNTIISPDFTEASYGLGALDKALEKLRAVRISVSPEDVKEVEQCSGKLLDTDRIRTLVKKITGALKLEARQHLDKLNGEIKHGLIPERYTTEIPVRFEPSWQAITSNFSQLLKDIRSRLPE